MTTKSGVYKIINKITKKFYLGSSINLSVRFYNHLRLLRRNEHHSKHLQQAYNKYGEDAFEFRIIELVDKIKLFKIEQKYLDRLSPSNSYNCSFDAGRITMTPVTRRKIGDFHKKRLKNKNNHHMFKKHHSASTKDKISKALMGKMIGIKSPLFGKKLPKSHPFRNGSISHKGVANGRYNYTIYTLRNIDTGEIFKGTSYEFYTKFDLNCSCIREVLNGRCKLAARKWKLIN